MAKYQNYNITYQPPWVVQLNMLQHRCITRIQITKASPDVYARMIDFSHAINHECNRMRKELDIGGDLREKRPPKIKKEG